MKLQAEMQLAGMALGQRLPVPETPWLAGTGARLVTDKHGAPALKYESMREELDANRPPRWTDDPSVLDAFAALADATPERVLAFAHRYGVLHLCKHGMQILHDSVPGRVVVCEAPNPEPVSVYVELAREVRAVLRLAAHVRQGRAGRKEDWTLLARGEEFPRAEYTVKNARYLLTLAIRQLLTEANVHATFTWRTGEPQVQLGGLGTFAAIVRHLAFAVARADRLVTCASCGRFFTPKRQQAGRESWCSTCGKKAADRASKRRQRARKGRGK